MFNGIIYNTGIVRTIKKEKKSKLIGVKSNLIFKKKDIGSSICCSGVCLTLTKIKKGLLFFYISNETLKKTNFKLLKIGQIINLEKSLKHGDPVSGNYTQGHVDVTAEVIFVHSIDKSWLVKLKIKDINLSKYLIEKASITINGVSLTISKVYKNYLYLNIIPHTLKLTNLKKLKKKDVVNVELDIFGKYIYKYSN